jgi:D-arabinose 1-dehydrogenase-like Zn-dependent alcohol dehydrogenase
MLLNHTVPIQSAPLRWVDLPIPEPGQREVRIKVHCCGVCRTDLHVIEGDLPQQKMPVISGHQIVGSVDAVGPKCRRLRIGQRTGVAAMDLRPLPLLRHGSSAHLLIQIARHRGCEVYVATRDQQHRDLADLTADRTGGTAVLAMV